MNRLSVARSFQEPSAASPDRRRAAGPPRPRRVYGLGGAAHRLGGGVTGVGRGVVAAGCNTDGRCTPHEAVWSVCSVVSSVEPVPRERRA
ncbi:hypothetical protein BN2537_423 [Streptomyces venezuelae]|nr:hypothetical protein BN2537_423 [Streptomyces venezuelae]